mmetsp:Transcript_7911/g.32110  ORF Transcript_7911/g.32110 Transcript_7911/m.32110 type:complete len:237 (+) Transcript_7911:616-1326(+)
MGMLVSLHEVLVHIRHDAVQVEALDAKDLVQVDDRVRGLDDVAELVDGVDLLAHFGLLVRGNEVCLVEQDAVSKGHLLLALVDAVLLDFVEVQPDVLGVNHCEDRVDVQVGLDVLIGKKGLCNGRGVGETGGLNHDCVELLLLTHQAVEDADEVAAHRAADAAVVHLEDLLLRLDHERVVDADLAELVLNHGDPLAMVARQDVVDERGLARAKEARHNRDGDLALGRRDPHHTHGG